MPGVAWSSHCAASGPLFTDATIAKKTTGAFILLPPAVSRCRLQPLRNACFSSCTLRLDLAIPRARGWYSLYSFASLLDRLAFPRDERFGGELLSDLVGARSRTDWHAAAVFGIDASGSDNAEREVVVR
jgi:hypothetical protein